MSIKAIFFDLDDTLHDHQLPFSKAFKEAFLLDVKKIHIESVYKRFRDFSDLLWIKYSNQELSLDELRNARIILALKDFHIEITEQQANDFQTRYEKESANLQLFPEVPDLLDMLNNSGIGTGIITNGPVQHQLNKIHLLGLTRFINQEMMIISDAVGAAKPNPQIFQYAAQKSFYSPHELLYIGDSWHNDVAAPIDAGWQSVWFNHRKRQPGSEHRPLAEIDCLTPILKIIKNVE